MQGTARQRSPLKQCGTGNDEESSFSASASATDIPLSPTHSEGLRVGEDVRVCGVCVCVCVCQNAASKVYHNGINDFVVDISSCQN